MKTEDIRGVNLGGWLVLERWITPGLFEGSAAIDEHSLGAGLGYTETKHRLENHRKAFFTKQDFEKIASLGINIVRVPVGYWLFEDIDGYLGGGDMYVDQVFSWAETYNLQILLCIHGVPGSQNGQDHSGCAGDVLWCREKGSRYDSLEFTRQLCQRYGRKEKLFGVELLNEPSAATPLIRLLRYYWQSGRIVEKYCHAGIRVVVSEVYRPLRIARWLPLLFFKRPVLDIHLYQLFTPEDRQLDVAAHITKAKRDWVIQLARCRRWVPVMVGEWSVAMEELHRPELKNTAQPYTNEDYARYAEAQREAFETAHCGWVYWTARTEDKGPWSLLDHPEFLKNSYNK